MKKESNSMNQNSYAGKTLVAAWLEKKGISVEREGDKLFALAPTSVRGTFERIEVRTMQDAIAVDKRIG